MGDDKPVRKDYEMVEGAYAESTRGNIYVILSPVCTSPR